MSNQSTSERIKEIVELEEKVTAMKNQLVLEKLIECSKSQEPSKEESKEFEFELKIESKQLEGDNTIDCFESNNLFKYCNFITRSQKGNLISANNITRFLAKNFYHIDQKALYKLIDFCEQVAQFENVKFDKNSNYNFKVFPNKLIIGNQMHLVLENLDELKEAYHEYLQEPNIVTFDLVKK